MTGVTTQVNPHYKIFKFEVPLKMNIIVVHGSVETSCGQPYLASLRQAALAGYRVLESGLVSAVEQSVMALEDDPLLTRVMVRSLTLTEKLK